MEFETIVVDVVVEAEEEDVMLFAMGVDAVERDADVALRLLRSEIELLRELAFLTLEESEWSFSDDSESLESPPSSSAPNELALSFHHNFKYYVLKT